MRKRWLAGITGIGISGNPVPPSAAPAWIFPHAGIDLNFATNQAYQAGVGFGAPANFITTSRASSGTNLLPISASGFAYSTFANNLPRITTGLGLLIEESRVNRLLNSAAPVTQTTASLALGTYTLWVNGGSGSATSSAATAVGTGFGAATQGSPNTFVVSTAGTVKVTVAGSLNAFQLELGTFGSSLIVTVGSVVTRAADVINVTTSPTFGTAITGVVFFTPQAPIAYANNQWVLGVTDGTTANGTNIYRANTSGKAVGNTVVASSQTFMIGNVVSSNASILAGVSVQNGAQALVVNAGSPVTATASWPPSATLSKTSIGSSATGAGQIDGYIARVAIWPTTAQSVPFLQQIT